MTFSFLFSSHLFTSLSSCTPDLKVNPRGELEVKQDITVPVTNIHLL